MSKITLGKESERKNVTPDVLKIYIEKLTKMVNCKTVWTHDGENNAEFDRFYATIEELFPNIASKRFESPLLDRSVS